MSHISTVRNVNDYGEPGRVKVQRVSVSASFICLIGSIFSRFRFWLSVLLLPLPLLPVCFPSG